MKLRCSSSESLTQRLSERCVQSSMRVHHRCEHSTLHSNLFLPPLVSLLFSSKKTPRRSRLWQGNLCQTRPGSNSPLLISASFQIANYGESRVGFEPRALRYLAGKNFMSTNLQRRSQSLTFDFSLIIKSPPATIIHLYMGAPPPPPGRGGG